MKHLCKRTLVPCILMHLMLAVAMRASGDMVPGFPKTDYQLLKSGHVTVDISNAEYGYIMAKHTGTKNNVKIVISHLLGENLYDLDSDKQYHTFPLSYGNGVYEIAVYEQAPAGTKGGKYRKIFAGLITVEMPDENSSFLYPNEYVWYTEFSFARAKSVELCEGITSDYEKVETIFSYIREHIRYDYVKALMVQRNYLPDVDQTLHEETGICFDYAALFACMLRVQGIPAQLNVGMLVVADLPLLHAWNKVWIGDKWFFFDPTFGNTRFDASKYWQQHVY